MSIDGSADSGARDVAEQLSKFCEWVPTVTARDIPEPIMRRAATVLCDDIAAIVAARDEPEVIKLQDRMVSRASQQRVDRLQRARRKGGPVLGCRRERRGGGLVRARRRLSPRDLSCGPLCDSGADRRGGGDGRLDRGNAARAGAWLRGRGALRACVPAEGAGASSARVARRDRRGGRCRRAAPARREAAQCGADVCLDDGGAGAVSSRRRRRAGAQRVARGGRVVRHAGRRVGGVRHRRRAAFALRRVRRRRSIRSSRRISSPRAWATNGRSPTATTRSTPAVSIRTRPSRRSSACTTSSATR